MNRRLSALATLVIIATCLGLGTIAFSHDDQLTGGKGTIVGQVTDVSGTPIEGVVVSIEGGPSTMTNTGGTFELTHVKQRKRIIVDFAKPGYVSTQAMTSLKTGTADGGVDGDEGETSETTSRKLESVTVIKTMLSSGATHSLDTSSEGTIAEEGSKVTFPAGSLTADGTVEVAVSPFDVSTSELGASPGEFKGIAQDGSEVMLETFAMMDVSITQSGQPVNLRPGAQATLEFLLPAAAPFAAGETVPLWFYSESRGTWIEEGEGTVGFSTFDPDRLSVTGAVGHFSGWGVSIPVHLSEQTCLKGIVRDSNGNRKAGVSVIAEGENYRSRTYAITNTAGEYCVMVKRESLARVIAFVQLEGAYATPSIVVMTPDTNSLGCLNHEPGSCAPIQDITLPPVSCIRGDVRDSFNNPIAGFNVFSSVGTSATTNAAGSFCLGAPGNSVVSVHAPGYPSAIVTTPDGDGSCAAGGCAVVAIRPAPEPTPTPTPTPTPVPTPSPTPEPGLSCLQVSATYLADGRPAASTTVRVFDDFGNVLMSGVTDATGKICFVNLPINTHVFLNASDGNGQSAGTDANTGSGGGSCALSNCVQVTLELSQGT